jgi:hypothetical protein
MEKMENIINKLNQIDDYDYDKPIWEEWSLEEKKQLLHIYLIICKKETHIFDLIYSYHGCDSWEDIFRDYDENDMRYNLREKTTGVEVALDEIQQIENGYKPESDSETDCDTETHET